MSKKRITMSLDEAIEQILKNQHDLADCIVKLSDNQVKLAKRIDIVIKADPTIAGFSQHDLQDIVERVEKSLSK